MISKHHGQFISRFCYDLTLLAEDLSFARLFPTVAVARETVHVMSQRLGVRPVGFKVRSVHANLDIPYPTITLSARLHRRLPNGACHSHTKQLNRYE
jgi:hypothetical protein